MISTPWWQPQPLPHPECSRSQLQQKIILKLLMVSEHLQCPAIQLTPS